MCDFKPGDEVVCVDATGCPELVLGAPYVVERILAPCEDFVLHSGDVIFCATDEPSVWVYGGQDFRDQAAAPEAPWPGYNTSRFRKVQKRNDRLTIEAFMTVPGGFEEPKRAPAKKRERVQ